MYRVNGPVNLVRLIQLIDQVASPEPCVSALRAGLAEEAPAAGQADLRSLAAMATCCCTTPSRASTRWCDFLREAVNDPEVLAIKQTMYRTGAESVLMER